MQEHQPNDNQNFDIAKYLIDLATDNPEKFVTTTLGIIQARLMREVMDRLQTALTNQLEIITKTIQQTNKHEGGNDNEL
jgi:hypothetical protein